MIITLPLKLNNYIIFLNKKDIHVLNIEIVRSIHTAKHRDKYIYIYIYIYISSAFTLENYACWQRNEAEPKLQVIRTKNSIYFPTEN